MPDERKVEKLEKGDPLHATRRDEEPDEELEVLTAYYPNLRPGVPPREWDEPPWGLEARDARSRKGRRS